MYNLITVASLWYVMCDVFEDQSWCERSRSPALPVSEPVAATNSRREERERHRQHTTGCLSVTWTAMPAIGFIVNQFNST